MQTMHQEGQSGEQTKQQAAKYQLSGGAKH
jgi:hypothetical protein